MNSYSYKFKKKLNVKELVMLAFVGLGLVVT